METDGVFSIDTGMELVGVVGPDRCTTCTERVVLQPTPKGWSDGGCDDRLSDV